MRLRKSSRKSTNTIGRAQAVWWRLCWERSLPNRRWPTRPSGFEEQAAAPLRAPQARLLRVRLLCGLVLFVSTWYCAHTTWQAGHLAAPGAAGRFVSGTGGVGIWQGVQSCPAIHGGADRSPQSVDRGGREELARQGIALNKKAVRRIATQLGAQMLALRQRELLAWRAGQLPAGSEFAGRRVAVQIDGGRVCLRENQNRQQKQRRRKGQRDKFHTLESADLGRTRYSGSISVLAASCDSALVQKVFARLCELRKTIVSCPTKGMNTNLLLKDSLKSCFADFRRMPPLRACWRAFRDKWTQLN